MLKEDADRIYLNGWRDALLFVRNFSWAGKMTVVRGAGQKSCCRMACSLLAIEMDEKVGRMAEGKDGEHGRGV